MAPKKNKGTTMNLADFVGEDKFRANMLPSQSEGKEKGGKGKGKGKGRDGDRDGGFGGGRDRDGDRGGGFERSRADDDDGWRRGGGGGGGGGFSKDTSSRGLSGRVRGGFGDDFRGGGGGGNNRDDDDGEDWRNARAAGGGDRFKNQNRFARNESGEGDKWASARGGDRGDRGGRGGDDFPSPGDARPAGLRNLKERMAAARDAKARGEPFEDDAKDEEEDASVENDVDVEDVEGEEDGDEDEKEDDEEGKEAAVEKESKKVEQKKNGKTTVAAAKKPAAPAVAHKVDEAILSSVRDVCAAAFSSGDGSSLSAKIKGIDSMSEEDHNSGLVAREFISCLFDSIKAGQSNEDVLALVQKFKAPITSLLESSKARRFKTTFLFQCQVVASRSGMPRLSPSWSVLEAVFDALYFAEIIEEQYFIWWVEDMNGMDVEGRMDAIFQVDPWVNWLKSARIEGEETEDESGSEYESEEDY